MSEITQARAARSAELTPAPGAEQAPELAERVARLRGIAREDPTVRPELAALLLRVAERHEELGQRREALTLTQEAERIHRELATAEPDRYRYRPTTRARSTTSANGSRSHGRPSSWLR